MEHVNHLTYYTANVVDEFAQSGVRHVVISPGSRSTPLAVLFTKHKQIKEWVLVDERSAAYFALGIAKALKQPVALVCTSGTAAANYFPAVIEAYHSRIPLLLLTADRPHHLRDVGAPQAMNQIGLYGHYVKLFYEMAIPKGDDVSIQYVRNRTSRAVKVAKTNNPGPVHMNFPFDEPLMPDLTLPDLWGENKQGPYNPVYTGENQLAEKQLESIAQMIKHKKGLLVCGPEIDEKWIEPIVCLSKHLQVPILADPLSNLRAGHHDQSTIVATYDTIFRSKKLRDRLKPDYIIRFGAMPVSKNYMFFITENKHITQFVVESNETVREPTNHWSHYILADPKLFCEQLLTKATILWENKSWVNKWREMEQIAKEELEQLESRTLTEGLAVRYLLEGIPKNGNVFIGNSMPVRDLDTFFMNTNKKITVYGNRGVSGIDGVVSSALGAAAATKQHLYLIIGDLSFYHDLNSLLIAKHYSLQMTIILINNNGGGIFSFLPQAKDGTYFEHLFGTPLNIDFHPAVQMYGGAYELVTTKKQYEKALKTAEKHKGLTVIEVQTNRKENVAWHRELWEKISQRLYKV